MQFGECRENRSESSFCFSGERMVSRTCCIMPLPLRRAGVGGEGGLGGIMTLANG